MDLLRNSFRNLSWDSCNNFSKDLLRNPSTDFLSNCSMDPFKKFRMDFFFGKSFTDYFMNFFTDSFLIFWYSYKNSFGNFFSNSLSNSQTPRRIISEIFSQNLIGFLLEITQSRGFQIFYFAVHFMRTGCYAVHPFIKFKDRICCGWKSCWICNWLRWYSLKLLNNNLHRILSNFLVKSLPN